METIKSKYHNIGMSGEIDPHFTYKSPVFFMNIRGLTNTDLNVLTSKYTGYYRILKHNPSVLSKCNLPNDTQLYSDLKVRIENNTLTDNIDYFNKIKDSLLANAEKFRIDNEEKLLEGLLLVLGNVGEEYNFCIQIYFRETDGMVYVRYIKEDNVFKWTEWKPLLTDTWIDIQFILNNNNFTLYSRNDIKDILEKNLNRLLYSEANDSISDEIERKYNKLYKGNLNIENFVSKHNPKIKTIDNPGGNSEHKIFINDDSEIIIGDITIKCVENNGKRKIIIKGDHLSISNINNYSKMQIGSNANNFIVFDKNVFVQNSDNPPYIISGSTLFTKNTGEVYLHNEGTDKINMGVSINWQELSLENNYTIQEYIFDNGEYHNNNTYTLDDGITLNTDVYKRVIGKEKTDLPVINEYKIDGDESPIKIMVNNSTNRLIYNSNYSAFGLNKLKDKLNMVTFDMNKIQIR